MSVITLNDIAGLATAKMTWRLMHTLATNWQCGLLADASPGQIAIDDDTYQLLNGAAATADIIAYRPPERATTPSTATTESAEVWTLGLMAFYALMGTDIFEHQGGKAQADDTPIPLVGESHCDSRLSELIHACLNYDPSKRPTMEQISKAAANALQQPSHLPKRVMDNTGKSYRTSLVSFWPEEMVLTVILLIMTLLSPSAMAQTTPSIPNEMQVLVNHCIALRNTGNTSRVSRDLQRDDQWTLMDEIAIDRKGECTINDKVDTFGLNDIGFRIFKQHSGVTNQGGRFRDGRDPRYRYSFIEITVKRQASVNYDISGREGKQLLAIVPHDPNARFTAAVTMGGKNCGTATMRDGVCYLSIDQNLRPSDHFKLTITNQSGKNMAYVIINHNSRK